jgi:uncharacterized membrane protein HdeD (DUF308 family)
MTSTESVDSAESIRSFGRQWWLIALFGVITIGFGIVLTFRPSKSVHTIAVIFAIWLLIVGAIRLIQAIGDQAQRTGLLIVGLLSIVVAIILLRHTSTAVSFVGFIIGIFWTVGGVAEIIQGFSAHDGGVSWARVILGLIATVIGVLCLVYPSLSLSIICVITGVGMIVYGAAALVASYEVRQLKDAK